LIPLIFRPVEYQIGPPRARTSCFDPVITGHEKGGLEGRLSASIG
jgi:hypothetical protein